MSFDHRAVDGAYVAAFLSTMSSILATHDFIAEL
ncbi:MAG: 2-oxo acid dehydrogenase subunit E2 [Actinobacteria bacterium]|nr:2-oxo acid dehydrogenase subunit E2 [Actinomycetota bacterium]MCL5885742.1 2-oxo acid dehydrogenase subunit E2 [Actinomycetota bacterium]MCL5886305.1 2-oxo acid dehydrogenase subunit E2 [Actinomycetota bacterium]